MRGGRVYLHSIPQDSFPEKPLIIPTSRGAPQQEQHYPRATPPRLACNAYCTHLLSTSHLSSPPFCAWPKSSSLSVSPIAHNDVVDVVAPR
eukprot:scaffold4220_cov102-Skeletonema_marinoi.AAC.3